MPLSDQETPLQTLRPNRRVFFFRPILRTALIISLLVMGAYFFLPLFLERTLPLPLLLGLVLFFTARKAIQRFAAYRKTFYHFYGDHLLVRTGTLFSEHQVDLPYRNVTQVVLRLPFLEHRLFQTGELIVHSAGSFQGTAHLESIDKPRRAYELVADYLRENGFSLKRERLVQRERPHIFGTLLDTSGLALGALMAMITVGLSVGGAVIDLLELNTFYDLFALLRDGIDPDHPTATEEQALAYRATLGLAILAVGGGITGLIRLFLHFVDLNRRTYTLFEDVIDYRDGFLTETLKFIPIENLADTSIAEPFFKRLFGVANVEVNPHGASGGIAFPSMPRAEQFRRRLNGLIDTLEPPRHESSTPNEKDRQHSQELSTQGGEHQTETHQDERRLFTPPMIQSSGPPLRYRPALRRGLLRAFARSLPVTLIAALMVALSFLGLLQVEDLFAEFEDILTPTLLALFPLLIFITALLLQVSRAIFFALTTRFSLGNKQIFWQRDFISRDEVEFTIDKITTVEVIQTFLDRILNTGTIHFTSIGNDAPLSFQDIANLRHEALTIRQRLRLFEAEPVESIRPRVTPWTFFFARPGLVFLAFLLALAALPAAHFWEPAIYLLAIAPALLLLGLIRDWLYFRRARLERFQDHLAITEGFFRRHLRLVSYAHARSIRTTGYPSSSSGTLTIVPGSDIPLRLPYLPRIKALHLTLDEELYRAPIRPVRQPADLDRLPVHRARPEARNAITLVLLLLFLAPLWPLLLPYLALRARRTSIIVEEGRLRLTRTLLYTREHTVLLNRIDQLITRRGPIHTLFKNGELQVLTIGSTAPELILGPLSAPEDLYHLLETRTRALQP